MMHSSFMPLATAPTRRSERPHWFLSVHPISHQGCGVNRKLDAPCAHLRERRGVHDPLEASSSSGNRKTTPTSSFFALDIGACVALTSLSAFTWTRLVFHGQS